MRIWVLKKVLAIMSQIIKHRTVLTYVYGVSQNLREVENRLLACVPNKTTLGLPDCVTEPSDPFYKNKLKR